MASENNNQGGSVKDKTAPGAVEASETNETSQSNEGLGEALNENGNLLDVLNEINAIAGGKNQITSIQPDLVFVVNFLIEKLKTVSDLFEDPLWIDVQDDMHEQRQNGQVPSLLVAVARNVPMEELTKLADDENYEDVQNAVTDRVSKMKTDEDSEKTLYSNFDKSKKAIDAYCAKMGYDDARKQKLYARIAKLRDIFADGLVTENEVAEIDKIDNYDSDIASIKSQIPQGTTKTALPDKASIDESMAKTNAPAPVQQPSLSNSMSGQPDYMNVGKRKIFTKS